MEVEMTKLETIFSAVLLLIAAIPMADARAEGDGLPTIDLQKNCHNRTAAPPGRTSELVPKPLWPRRGRTSRPLTKRLA